MKQQGWTIIQTMIALVIAGIVGTIVVRAIIDMRCEEDATRPICTKR
jgi:type II secretory pathway pseudopilin PulG